MRDHLGYVVAILLVLSSFSALAADFTGFWKADCADAFGVQIKPHGGKNYSVSFCGPSGCFDPGVWKPNTPIAGDSAYRIIDAKTIEIRQDDGWQRYVKCMKKTNPELDYSTMKDRQLESNITFFEANRGLPNYDKFSPFIVSATQSYESLERRLSAILIATTSYCEISRVPVPEFGDAPLYSNVCNKAEFESLRELLSTLAPSLDKNRLTFWKTDLDFPGQNGLLVGYIDISEDKQFKYPYLSLWYLGIERGGIRAVYGGTYLVGQVHAIRAFGRDRKRKRVFVKYQSCLECHPWIFQKILDFTSDSKVKYFQFSYASDHKKYADSFEYVLPGMGHSIDADVEVRLPKFGDKNVPHLYQHFAYRNEAKHEWWVYTCKALKCDYEMYEKELPSKYQASWDLAEKL